MFEERGHAALKDFQDESTSTRAAWFSHLMPETGNDHVVELSKNRRFVVLQGAPGTGKTRMTRQILASDYGGFGRSVQQAELPFRGRRVRVWLTAMPMCVSPERVASPLRDQFRFAN